MTRAEREAAVLLEKIRQGGAPVPEGARFERQRAGWAARASGALSWFLVGPDGLPLHPDVGSQFPRRRLRGEIEVSWDHHTRSWRVDPKEWPR